MINRNKMKYTKIKNVSKKKTNKLSIIEKTKRTLKRKLNNKKRTNLKGKVNINNKKKIKSKFKERTKLLLDGKKITKKVVGGGPTPRAPKMSKARRKAVEKGLKTYTERTSWGTKRVKFTDGTKIKSGWMRRSSGREIAIQQRNIDINKSKLKAETNKINDIKSELNRLSKKNQDLSPADISNVKKLTERLRAKEKSLEGLKKEIDTGKQKLEATKLKQESKSQGFNRWNLNKYKTKNLDSTLKRLESGKYSYRKFSRGRYNVLKNMGDSNRQQLRTNIDEINTLRKEGKDKDGKKIPKEQIEMKISELKTENAQLYRKGILQQKINKASKKSTFRTTLDITKAKELQTILNSNNQLTKNFMKKADLKVKLKKLDNLEKAGVELTPKEKLIKQKNTEKLEKLNETDTYVKKIIDKAEKGITKNQQLSENISKTQGEIAKTKAEVAISKAQETIDQTRIDKIPYRYHLKSRFQGASKKLLKTTQDLQRIIDNKEKIYSDKQISAARKRLSFISEKVRYRTDNQQLKNVASDTIKRREAAATKIQALFRGNKARRQPGTQVLSIRNLSKMSPDQVNKAADNSKGKMDLLKKNLTALNDVVPQTPEVKDQIKKTNQELTIARNIYLKNENLRNIHKIANNQVTSLDPVTLRDMIIYTVKTQQNKELKIDEVNQIIRETNNVNIKSENYDKKEISQIFDTVARNYKVNNPITESVYTPPATAPANAAAPVKPTNAATAPANATAAAPPVNTAASVNPSAAASGTGAAPASPGTAPAPANAATAPANAAASQTQKGLPDGKQRSALKQSNDGNIVTRKERKVGFTINSTASATNVGATGTANASIKKKPAAAKEGTAPTEQVAAKEAPAAKEAAAEQAAAKEAPATKKARKKAAKKATKKKGTNTQEQEQIIIQNNLKPKKKYQNDNFNNNALVKDVNNILSGNSQERSFAQREILKEVINRITLDKSQYTAINKKIKELKTAAENDLQGIVKGNDQEIRNSINPVSLKTTRGNITPPPKNQIKTNKGWSDKMSKMSKKDKEKKRKEIMQRYFKYTAKDVGTLASVTNAFKKSINAAATDILV